MKHTFLKSIALFLALLLTIFTFAACQPAVEKPDDEGNGTDVENGEDVKTDDPAGTFIIGGIGPLTGSAASYGISVKQGAQIAVDEINEQGGVLGYEFKLLFEDDEADAEKGVSAYNKLIDKKINALLGSVTSGSCIAVSEESFKDGILQVTPSASALEAIPHPNSFRICFTDPLQGELMAQYIKDGGFNSVAVIYDISSDYSKGIADAFIEKAAEIGLEIAAEESFTDGDVDFKTQLTSIKSSNAEALFLPMYYTEAGYISEQAVTVGVNLPYFGSDGWDGIIAQLEGNTENIEGASFLTPFIATSDEEHVVSFVKAYEDAYKTTPDQFAADGYDAVYVIKAAIEKAQSIDSDAMIAAMTEFEFEGVTGKMSFSEDGEPDKVAMVAVIYDGDYTVAK